MMPPRAVLTMKAVRFIALHMAEARGVEQADRFRCFRTVDRDEIGARHRGVQVLHRRVAEIASRSWRR
jgi:hypothetical protein